MDTRGHKRKYDWDSSNFLIKSVWKYVQNQWTTQSQCEFKMLQLWQAALWGHKHSVESKVWPRSDQLWSSCSTRPQRATHRNRNHAQVARKESACSVHAAAAPTTQCLLSVGEFLTQILINCACGGEKKTNVFPEDLDFKVCRCWDWIKATGGLEMVQSRGDVLPRLGSDTDGLTYLDRRGTRRAAVLWTHSHAAAAAAAAAGRIRNHRGRSCRQEVCPEGEVCCPPSPQIERV